jgi:hypothetical protein
LEQKDCKNLVVLSLTKQAIRPAIAFIMIRYVLTFEPLGVFLYVAQATTFISPLLASLLPPAARCTCLIPHTVQTKYNVGTVAGFEALLTEQKSISNKYAKKTGIKSVLPQVQLCI